MGSFRESAAADVAGRPVALFIHKPLFNEAPTEEDVNGRYVRPDDRRRVAYTFGAGAVDIETVEPPELTTYDRDQFPNLYP